MKRPNISGIYAFAISIVIAFSCPVYARSTDQVIHGQVISVANGDTLTVVVDYRQVRVRLTEIDAPEKNNPLATVRSNPSRIFVSGSKQN